MKTRPLGVQFFLTYRRTDRDDEVNICFSQFCEHVYKFHNVSFHPLPPLSETRCFEKHIRIIVFSSAQQCII
jgi:hypothetical protein